MTILTIIGARPQFIKAAAVSRLLRQQCRELLVHTGQHYDYGMSQVFFDELAIPAPEINLGIGSGAHGAQTGAMLAAIEQVLLEQRPDALLVYGDTNSTLAGALAAAKLGVPVAHIEAGLRSFNRTMPEEINRVMADHLATLLLCPSSTAVANLEREGLTKGVHLVGDVMADALLMALARAQDRSTILERLKLNPGGYLLATVHRAENTDDPARLQAILAAFAALDEPLIFPVHPRTRKLMGSYQPPPHVHLIEPLGYLDMVRLQQAARMILTDSGGIQKEAYWLGVPCVTMRDETEWVETVELGWNRLVGADTGRIVAAVRDFTPPAERPPLYGGDGHAAERCVAQLKEWR
ncbi:non-hydrolyzing UDP-N-acetylglucosamine 2-epimerase [Candidatus Viridilinea mediisalina]|uniref:UDP-N-acetylglucosamine 2-epimerase (Non-hydrolyzing) n=1 Tax=Candidatus Viridilinea mediisalina TaxID=2024553 RepID=A0A2A6RME7_9CHLR|nr:UDP-N-acetylglucosamine 2-epimerase (non-hydrolyzing) [Candidatus Viridilinea mediisalina]PDW04029.1 UDP-N-acetylglucosamine 2-epimerase (non-hydrolyzing) [Candidatus Viridilinea mediisalina]